MRWSAGTVGVVERTRSGPATLTPLAGVPGSQEVVCWEVRGHRKGLGLAWPHMPLDGVSGSHEVL